MSDLPSTPPTKTPPSVAPTPAASSDPSPQQGADRETANAKTPADGGREVANAPAVTLSASVAGLLEGATVSGQVAKKDASGRPTIRAEAATFAVLTNTSLKAGQSVVLNVTATTPSLRASLIQIDGAAPPRAHELRLAVIDIPPDRLAARAKIDAIIASPPETAAPTPESGTVRALFIGQTTNEQAPPPAIPPGSVLTANIESVSRPKHEDKQPSGPPRTSVAVSAKTGDAATTSQIEKSESQPPTAKPVEPLLRFGGAGTEPAAQVEPIEANVAPQRSAATSAIDTTVPTATAAATAAPAEAVQSSPAPSPTLATPSNTTATATPTANAPSAAAANLPVVVGFTGQVVGTTVENRAIVETPSGLFALDTAGQVEAGAIVTFSVSAQSENGATAAQRPTPPAVTFPNNLTTTAIVSGPAVVATSSDATTPPLAPLPSGTQLTVRILGPAIPIEPLSTVAPASVTPAPSPAGQLNTVAPAQATPTGGPQQPPAAGATQRTDSPGSQAATTPRVTRADAPHPVAEPRQAPQPGEPADTPKNPLPPLTGLVVGHSVSGQAVVQTPVGLLTIDGLEAAPRDSSIQIEVRAERPAPSSPTTPPTNQMTPQSILLTLGQEWQTLKEIVSVVAANDAAAAQRFVSNSAPAMNNRLASSMLFFFVAIQGGVPRTWLGDAATKALERAGRRDLIDRLGDDFSGIRKLSEERGPGDWRTFLFPFFDGDELQQIRMFMRHGDGGEEEEEEDGGGRRRNVRFVVDVKLTQLGELQLDGLVQDRRFDLIVRSKSDLTPKMREDISAIFGDGVEATGFDGSVVFEKAPDFPVSPFDEVLRGAEGDQVRV